MKKKIIALFLALAMMTSLVACGGGNNAADSGSSSGGSSSSSSTSSGGDTVTAKLAIVGPITGEYAEYGAHMVNSAEMAVAEWNAKKVQVDGKTVNFEVVVYDDAGKADEGAAVAEQVVSDDAIIGIPNAHFQSSVALVACPTYQNAGILALSNASSHADYVKIGPYVCRNNVDDLGEARNYVQMLYRMGYRKIALAGEESDFGVSTASHAMNAVKDIQAAGGDMEVVANEFFATNTDDYSAVISKLSASGAEVVLCTGTYPQVAPFAIQSKKAGAEYAIHACGNSLDDNLITVGGDAVEGLCLVSLFNADTKNELGAAFVEEYIDYCGNTPNHIASLCYDSASYIMWLVEQTGSLDRETLMKAAHELKMEGVTGTIVFDENNYCDKVQVVMEIKDGKFVESDIKLSTFTEFLASF